MTEHALKPKEFDTMRARFIELTALPTPELVQEALKWGAEIRASWPAHIFALETLKAQYGTARAETFYRQFRQDLKYALVEQYHIKPTYIYPRPVLTWVKRDETTEIDNNWLVFNAPRPLNGHARAQGEFIFGVFYSALDPIEWGAARTLETILADDGKWIVFVDEQGMANIRFLYRTTQISKYGQDAGDLFDSYNLADQNAHALDWFQKNPPESEEN